MANDPHPDARMLGKPVAGTGVDVAIIEIDKQAADDIMMRYQGTNRPLNNGTVELYAEEMRAGRWVLSGQPIIFDKEGHLLDGQHRIAAVYRTGIPLTTLAVYGVDPASFKVMDVGQKRSAAQVLAMMGEINVADLSACAGLLWHLDAKQMAINTRLTPLVRMEVIERHPEIRASISAIRRHSWVMRHAASTSTAEVLHYLALQRHNEAVVEEFFGRLNTGQELSAGSPILTLREWLIQQKEAPGAVRWREMWPIYLQAWNAWIDGTLLKRIVYVPAGQVDVEHLMPH